MSDGPVEQIKKFVFTSHRSHAPHINGELVPHETNITDSSQTLEIFIPEVSLLTIL